ncbi:vacuolar protein sorting-associated protein 32 homolog 1-like isoform X1 [Eucalyptus grandis]|uniref:vacuolar protein sorting-associated protein 32 homolog 1-like isoform X1 n=1 Tax=Eucalyptus grandis TaxID=71139 RepID=UPI00192ECA18|nr:vacuolar protein sorting-associated protein 32 homolog 1-like isoform X1 [Eucalyptus grandis]
MFSWMRWLLKKLNLETDAQRLSTTMDKLNMRLRKLKKEAQAFEKNASGEVEKAKEFIRAGNREAAKLCLRKKRLYEQQIEQFRHYEFQIGEQIIKLKGAKAKTETVDALKIAAAAMQEMEKAMGKIMNEVDLMASSRQTQDSLPTTSGAATEVDEDELEAELNELEGADPVPQRTAEEDELAALQAEMPLGAGQSSLLFSKASIKHFIVVGL